MFSRKVEARAWIFKKIYNKLCWEVLHSNLTILYNWVPKESDGMTTKTPWGF